MRLDTQQGISGLLAAWLADLDHESIPRAATEAAVASVIDVVGLCLAARHEPYTAAAMSAWQETGDCTVFGSGSRRDPYGAALINGTAAHGEDFDNTFEGCPVHSGAVVVPAVLALAQTGQMSGRHAIGAITIGIELMCRLGLVARKGIHTAGFHPTAILGTLSAAAAAGFLLKLTPRQYADALGVAGSLASGIIEYLADGSWTKRMHPGWAAQSGMRAAQMGRAGFRGPAKVFEGEHGLFSSFAPSLDPDFSQLTDDLGSVWQAANVAFKPFACGTMTQPYIDCAIALHREGIKPSDIVDIVCETSEGTLHRLWEPLALKQAPPNAYAAKFSTPYCVAIGVIDGDAGLRQFTDERVRQPDVMQLAGRVRYVVDPDNEYPLNYTGHLRATLADGRVVEKRQATLRGGVREPMRREELIAKYRSNARYGGVDERAADNLLEALLGLEKAADMGQVGLAAREAGIR